MPYYTHAVAVNAYLFKEERFLLLKRKQAPRIWTPPGGKLKTNEDPIQGLIREIFEETGLDIQVMAPINTWFGTWKNRSLLSIDYLARWAGRDLKLSGEHSGAAWVTLEELSQGHPVSLHPEIGFQLEDFARAYQLQTRLHKTHR